MPTPVPIRAFRPEDYPAARALWQATPGVGLSAADERAPVLAFLARNPGLSLVAEADGALAATILVGHDGRRGYIHHLATAAPFQRLGLARCLVGRALAGLAREGIGKCHFFVFADNAPARAFWSRLGAEERTSLGLWSLPTG
jgi:ribosomal protein S18 acetylase RimI-like enzyme